MDSMAFLVDSKIAPKKERFERCVQCGKRFGWIFIPDIERIMPCVCECDDIGRIEKQLRWIARVYEQMILPENRENDDMCPF